MSPPPAAGQRFKRQTPGFRQGQVEAFRPFHGHQGMKGFGLLLFLKEEFIGCCGVFQSVEIEMHEGWMATGVVLREGKGWAGDRFVDSQTLRQPLHQRCFAGAQGPVEQQNRPWRQLLGQLAPKGMGGLKGLKMPDTPCRVLRKRARSLGVSAAIDLHDS